MRFLRHKTQIIVPCLLKFNDDKVSIPPKFMDKVKDEVENYFDKNYKSESGEVLINKTSNYQYFVDKESLKDVLDIEGDFFEYCHLEVYYYHHRIILKYSFVHKDKIEGKFDSGLREKITKHANDTILDLTKKINETNKKNKNDKEIFNSENLSKDCMITMFYSYTMIFQKKSKKYLAVLTNRLETMFFKVYLPNKRPFSFGNETFVRISIPGMNVFRSGKMTQAVEADFINAVYQEMLYQKKIKDKEHYNTLKDEDKKKFYSLKKDNIEVLNRIDETILKNMWEYSIDTLSGRISDHQQSKVSRNTYILGGIGFIIALAGLFISIFS